MFSQHLHLFYRIVTTLGSGWISINSSIYNLSAAFLYQFNRRSPHEFSATGKCKKYDISSFSLNQLKSSWKLLYPLVLCQWHGVLGPLDAGDGPPVTGEGLFVPAAWSLGLTGCAMLGTGVAGQTWGIGAWGLVFPFWRGEESNVNLS